MKKNIKAKIIVMLIISIIVLMFTMNIVRAVTTTTKETEINKIEKMINTKDIKIEEIINSYKELSKDYTNDEIANLIEENKQEIIKSGVSAEVIDTGTQILKTTDTEGLKKIINNDINAKKIQEKLDQGYSPKQAIEETMTLEQTLAVGMKLLFSNNAFKIILITSSMFLIYDIIIKWSIYKKAGKHGWATLIPIYRNVVYLKLCGISPWSLLFILLPVIGWLILLIILVISKFRYSEAFGRGMIFGFGLWLFPIIFETILACSKKPYIGLNRE